MTPEELNRTIEFIIQSQARLAAGQEQDREDRLVFEKWSKGVTRDLALVHQRMNELLVHSNARLERSEGRLERAESEDRAAQRRHEELLQAGQRRHEELLQTGQRRHEELLKEIRAGFALIIEKLSRPS